MAAEGLRIFVTKVSQNLDEDHLRAYFGAFGELSDCYVPRVPGKAGHKGIGFVTYADHSAGEQVLLQAVHLVAGEEVTVDRATARTEKGGKGKGGDPYMGGYAAAYAPMRAAPAYKTEKGGKGKGGDPYMNGFAAAYAPVRAAAAYRSASAPAAGKGGMAPGVRVFVTKIAPTLEEDSIRAYFGAFGELSDCYMPRVPGRNGHKGIAFVTFVNAREGEQVLASPVHNISGEEVAVDRAVPREEKGAGKGAYMPPAAAFSYAPPAGKGRSAGPPPGQVDDETRRLFITKVPDSVTQDHVRDYFAAYGEIEDVYLPRRFGTSRHKGMAFVSFVYAQSATDVLAAGAEAHYINGEQVVVDRAAPRDAAGGKGGGRSAPYPSGKGGGAGFNAHNMFAAYASQMGWAPPAQSSYPGVQRPAYGALNGYGKGR
eukprot:CAMPEP_0204449322 /NCGR_PEP_ID=MMETSP0470-20130426/99777_1 /ASSEMBLY_ACC=CAM_ASM_000385 /TAXON_ID=2969 /ORGANISM="Oxyrrhis marina" /LENGTH=426 /DNA_ID=CAMNT_0051449139 /DNA_START=59 /DNA_END=1339 /DNA_ORIENTATION=+